MMKKFVALFLGCCVASAVQAAVVYNWTGPCQTGCTGDASAVITFTDEYQPGTVVGQFDADLFESLVYASSTGSFTITRATLNSTDYLFTIDPSIGTDSQVTDGVRTWFIDADRVGGGQQWFARFAPGSFNLGPSNSAGSFTPAPVGVPEPGTLALLGLGLAGLGLSRRRKAN